MWFFHRRPRPPVSDTAWLEETRVSEAADLVRWNIPTEPLSEPAFPIVAQGTRWHFDPTCPKLSRRPLDPVRLVSGMDLAQHLDHCPTCTRADRARWEEFSPEQSTYLFHSRSLVSALEEVERCRSLPLSVRRSVFLDRTERTFQELSDRFRRRSQETETLSLLEQFAQDCVRMIQEEAHRSVQELDTLDPLDRWSSIVVPPRITGDVSPEVDRAGGAWRDALKLGHTWEALRSDVPAEFHSEFDKDKERYQRKIRRLLRGEERLVLMLEESISFSFMVTPPEVLSLSSSVLARGRGPQIAPQERTMLLSLPGHLAHMVCKHHGGLDAGPRSGFTPGQAEIALSLWSESDFALSQIQDAVDAARLLGE